MHSSFMKFNFGKLHYQFSDSNKNASILFLHSLNSSAASFSKIHDLLKANFNIFCLDFPGHGLSDYIDPNKYSQFYSLVGLTTILIEFLDRLQPNNLFIVGNSMSGNIAIRTIPFLQKIQGIVLMGSIQARSRVELFKYVNPIAPMNLLFKNKLNTQEIITLSKAYIYNFKTTQFGLKQMRNDIIKTDGNFREQFIRNIEAQEWVDELQIIKNTLTPLIYILGLQDCFINSEYYMNALIENGLLESQIKLLNQVGHIPHLDNASLCGNIISKFITDKI